jgi:hypothetical protein
LATTFWNLKQTIVEMERLFDNHDVSKEAAIKNQEEEVMDLNIGTAKNPKIVKLQGTTSRTKK